VQPAAAGPYSSGRVWHDAVRISDRQESTVRAAVLNSIPGHLDIEDVQIGEPGPREVLIRTAAAGLCHSDLHFMEGKYSYPCPAVLGHESAGVVEAVGSMVHYVQPGDHVITCLSAFCGHCSQCTDGHLSLCENKGTELVRQPGEPPRLRRGDGEVVNQYLHLSSFAEQMLVHEQALVKIDPEMPLDIAALIGCGVTTGLGAVFRTAKVSPGETVAVIGCGGIGLSAIQGARIAGANRIIAVDMNEAKLELAQQLGATHVVNASIADPVLAVKELTGGGVHHAFEAVGLKVTAEQSFQMLRNGGQATVIGMIPLGVKIELSGVDLLYEKTMTGSNMGSNQFRTDMPRYIDMYLDGRLQLDEMVSERISLDEVNDGFEEMKTGTVARSVIVFD
jgi:S-(hydroxymethyl)glutathione dehydrogenase / alcohol dehydrogenase